MRLLKPEKLTTIRTAELPFVPVYFYFDGNLYEVLENEIKFVSYFRGFNVAQKVDNTRIVSKEYVDLGVELNPIENNHIQFEMGIAPFTPTGSLGRLVDLPIPVNRDDYTALEHFTFFYEEDNLNEVGLAWTRYGSIHGEGNYIYCGKGYKFFEKHQEQFPDVDMNPPEAWKG